MRQTGLLEYYIAMDDGYIDGMGWDGSLLRSALACGKPRTRVLMGEFPILTPESMMMGGSDRAETRRTGMWMLAGTSRSRSHQVPVPARECRVRVRERYTTVVIYATAATRLVVIYY